MPACEHCGKVVSARDIAVFANGRTELRLCPMCRAQMEWKDHGDGALRPPGRLPEESWWKRAWRKLFPG